MLKFLFAVQRRLGFCWRQDSCPCVYVDWGLCPCVVNLRRPSRLAAVVNWLFFKLQGW